MVSRLRCSYLVQHTNAGPVWDLGVDVVSAVSLVYLG
jgi:hypothetical protein